MNDLWIEHSNLPKFSPTLPQGFQQLPVSSANQNKGYACYAKWLKSCNEYLMLFDFVVIHSNS